MKKKIAFCCMVLTSLLLFASVVIASQETEKGNSKSCVILIPRDMDPDSFLKETEWELFSRLDRFDLRVLSADWIGDPDQSLQLLEDTCEGILRNSQTEDTQDLFLIGYEEGADFAAGEICEHTDRYAGAVLLGGNGLTEDQLTEYAGYPYKEALSVWVLAPKKPAACLPIWRTGKKQTGLPEALFVPGVRISVMSSIFLPHHPLTI